MSEPWQLLSPSLLMTSVQKFDSFVCSSLSIYHTAPVFMIELCHSQPGWAAPLIFLWTWNMTAQPKDIAVFFKFNESWLIHLGWQFCPITEKTLDSSSQGFTRFLPLFSQRSKQEGMQAAIYRPSPVTQSPNGSKHLGQPLEHECCSITNTFQNFSHWTHSRCCLFGKKETKHTT